MSNFCLISEHIIRRKSEKRDDHETVSHRFFVFFWFLDTFQNQAGNILTCLHVYLKAERPLTFEILGRERLYYITTR